MPSQAKFPIGERCRFKGGTRPLMVVEYDLGPPRFLLVVQWQMESGEIGELQVEPHCLVNGWSDEEEDAK